MATLDLRAEADNETLQYHLMVLKNNQHQLLGTTKTRELIEEVETINPYHPHQVILVETPTQTMIQTMMTMERMTEGERAAGRHALLDDHQFPEILLPKQEQFNLYGIAHGSHSTYKVNR